MVIGLFGPSTSDAKSNQRGPILIRYTAHDRRNRNAYEMAATVKTVTIGLERRGNWNEVPLRFRAAGKGCQSLATIRGVVPGTPTPRRPVKKPLPETGLGTRAGTARFCPSRPNCGIFRNRLPPCGFNFQADAVHCCGTRPEARRPKLEVKPPAAGTFRSTHEGASGKSQPTNHVRAFQVPEWWTCSGAASADFSFQRLLQKGS